VKKLARVIKAYQTAYAEPWCISIGEQILIGDRDTEWEGWVWCTNSVGESRWAPEIFFERHGDIYIALRDYESTELSVQVGEILLIGEEECGWGWCSKDAGHSDQSGWVPLEFLEEV